MNLESLLKPVEFVDEQVERQYAKVRKRIDEKGTNIYSVTLPLNCFFAIAPILTDPLLEGVYAGFDLGLNLKGILGIKTDEVSDGAIAVNRFDNLASKVTNTLRLPVFLTGAGLTAMGLYQLADTHLFYGDSNSAEGMRNLVIGLGWLSQASSVYLKNSDPKLLDKEPVWKTAYEWIREKISSLAPQPLSQPAASQAYSGLEDYIQAQPVQ